MALPNPTLHLPRLSTKPPSLPSRSPSRSPMRPARDFDPLLRNLSPTSTLRIFAVDPHQLQSTEHDLPVDLATASASQRSLGVQAAQTCLDLRAWAGELELWEWPGTFDLPDDLRKRVRMSDRGHDTETFGLDDELEHGFWGSMPAMLVLAYEQRAGEIRLQVDEIDVEELKDYVLAAHQLATPGTPTHEHAGISALASTPDLHRLDDFTAIITATILQALPYLSKVMRLLHLWTIRLSILRRAPTYINDLQHVQIDLDRGWTALAVAPSAIGDPRDAGFGRNNMIEMQGVMEGQVRSLGRRLDRFLDELEGQNDAVPDAWIDEFEILESAYGDWVVQAERKVLENEWQRSHSPHALDQADATQDGEAADEAQSSEQLSPRPSLLSAGGGERSLQSDRSSNSMTHSRHVPIVIDYERDAKLYNPELAISPDEEVPSTMSRSETDDLPAPSVKKRAAFLKAKIEGAESLQKQVKSPVRPFEHASNAFTRLFKKDRTPEQPQRLGLGRSVSIKSAGSKSDSRSTERGRNALTPVVTRSAELDSSVSPAARSSRPTTRNSDAGGSFFHRRRDSSARRNRAPRDYIDLPGGLPEELAQSRPITPNKSVPATYQPTGIEQTYQHRPLSQPFRSATTNENELPDNWPLSAPGDPPDDDSRPREQVANAMVDASYPERDINPFRNPMVDGDFHDRFVDSLPNSPQRQGAFNPAELRSAFYESPRQDAATLGRLLDTEVEDLSPLDIFNAQQHEFDTLFASSDPTQTVPNMTTEVPTTNDPLLDMQSERADDSPGSVDFTLSSGEIHDANSVGYFPHRPSPVPSRTASGNPPEHLYQLPKPASPMSPAILRLMIPNPQENTSNGQTATSLKRASVTSIGTHARSELKSVQILPRKESANSSVFHTPADSEPVSAIEAADTGVSFPSPSLTHDDLAMFPMAPVSTSSDPDSPISPIRATHASGLGRLYIASSPISERDINHSPVSPNESAPLNAIMLKQRPQQASYIGRTSRMHEDIPSTQKSVRPHSVPEDSFDRRVSKVLERLPDSIKFRARAGAETPVQRLAEQRGMPGRLAPRYAQVPSRSSSFGMTIAPAEPSPKKSSVVAEAVKLYHLRAEGREEPIKLFVRLVGEDERCMVRVGGGWQDLADYLRQYAEHHGSRTVSGSGLEVHTAEANANGSTRRVSGPAAPRAQTPVTSVFPNDSRPASKDGAASWLHDAQPQFTMGEGEEEEEEEQPFSSAPESPIAFLPHAVASQHATPRSLVAFQNNSRPSTADTARPSSQASMTDPAASSARRAELADQKAKWVEGMIEKARASAEKSKDDRFVEMGKIGGTRRIIFRSPSAQGEHSK